MERSAVGLKRKKGIKVIPNFGLGNWQVGAAVNSDEEDSRWTRLYGHAH